MKTTRRNLLFTTAAAQALSAPLSSSELESIALKNNAATIEAYLKSQNTEAASRWYGGFPDAYGLYNGAAVMAVFDPFIAGMVHPKSKYFRSAQVFERLQLAGVFLDRHTSPDGNVQNPQTNFNSAPDTSFGARGMAMGVRLAQVHREREVLSWALPHLTRAGRAMAKGGLHTPNHRWILCAALAQIHEVAPDPSYLKRIDAWLREGIDIDEDGQYSERSTGTYNIFVNSALVLLADKLKRWELLDPVRRNLEAVLCLMDSGGDLLTDISTRQDQFSRANIASYWFALHYLALRDNNPVYAGLALPHVRDYLSLSDAMTWPDFLRTDLVTKPPADDYVKRFAKMGVTRIRRGEMSGTILSAGNSRFFQFRNGEAVVNSVRFASGFFGKGQFRPSAFERTRDGYVLMQKLEAPYYQPVDQEVGMQFQESRRLRAKSEVCTLTQRARIVEQPDGFDLELSASGTDEVPVTVEVNLREGGVLEGVEPTGDGAFFLKSGGAAFRLGGSRLQFGPGRHEHTWTAVRGADRRLPGGVTVYLTGFTPFAHTLRFRKA
jgi:hypothetical protein